MGAGKARTLARSGPALALTAMLAVVVLGFLVLRSGRSVRREGARGGGAVARPASDEIADVAALSFAPAVSVVPAGSVVPARSRRRPGVTVLPAASAGIRAGRRTAVLDGRPTAKRSGGTSAGPQHRSPRHHRGGLLVLAAGLMTLAGGAATVAGLPDGSAAEPTPIGPLAFPTPSIIGAEQRGHWTGNGDPAIQAGGWNPARPSVQPRTEASVSGTSSVPGVPTSWAAVATSGPVRPSGTVRGPRGSSTVPATVTLTGTVQGLTAEQQAWLVLLDVRARRYYPQRRALIFAADGTWTARVAVGPESATSRAFQVLLMAAENRAATKLASYGARPAGGSGSGLGKLPAGTTTLASLSLRRA